MHRGYIAPYTDVAVGRDGRLFLLNRGTPKLNETTGTYSPGAQRGFITVYNPVQ